MSTLKNNGLLLANLVLFLVFLGGMTVSGWQVYNDEQVQHGSSAVTLGEYVATGRGSLRELGERGAADGRVRRAHGIPLSARLV
jgi:hypothetical protein